MSLDLDTPVDGISCYGRDCFSASILLPSSTRRSLPMPITTSRHLSRPLMCSGGIDIVAGRTYHRKTQFALLLSRISGYKWSPTLFFFQTPVFPFLSHAVLPLPGLFVIQAQPMRKSYKPKRKKRGKEKKRLCSGDAKPLRSFVPIEQGTPASVPKHSHRESTT